MNLISHLFVSLKITVRRLVLFDRLADNYLIVFHVMIYNKQRDYVEIAGLKIIVKTAN